MTGYLEAGIGAVIGFVLAQLVGFAKILREHWRRPKLVIIAKSSSELETTQYHTIYGCLIKNTGRTIAAGVRIQVVRIEGRHGNNWICLSECSHDLAPYQDRNNPSENRSLALVPSAAIEVAVASKSDHPNDQAYDGIVFPANFQAPDWFEQLASDVDEYRYTVIAFDEAGHFAKEILTIR